MSAVMGRGLLSVAAAAVVLGESVIAVTVAGTVAVPSVLSRRQDLTAG
jgi:hypothetical protein